MDSVMADEEACDLLRVIDAACAVLLRCVSNVLQIRALQRDGVLAPASPQCCELDACIARAVALVCAFCGDPPRVAWSSWPGAVAAAPLPLGVQVDTGALDACLLNVLLAAVRFGAWLPTRNEVRLHVSTEPVIPAAVQLNVIAQGRAPEENASDDAFHLVITAETPGRPLTRDECDTLLAPFGMAPPDKGGGSGLSLFVARGLARGMGGDVTIDTEREDATFITLRLPLRVQEAAMMARVSPPPSPSSSPASPESSPGGSRLSSSDGDESPAGLGGGGLGGGVEAADELHVTSRMFECLLTNSDDVFALCRLTPCAEEPFGLSVKVTYISPSIERGLAFCQQAVVGASLLSVCMPEDRPAFAKAIAAAHRGDGPDGRHVACMHRSMTAAGGSVWCHTCGLVDGDVMYLVCRDVRARKSVELAMRAFTLATTHDVRECCNAVLVSTAVLEKRDCITASAGSPPPSQHNSAVSSSAAAAAAAAAADDMPLEPHFLVSCIRTACGLILGIVGNVLTAPQVEEGHMRLDAEVFSPKALLRDVMQACRMGCAAAAQPGGSPIVWEEAEEALKLPPLVESDRNRLAQVVQCVRRLLACLRCCGGR